MKETFFQHFNNPCMIDVPGFNQDEEQHKRERAALKGFFDKTTNVEEYDKIALDWHRKTKKEFFQEARRRRARPCYGIFRRN